MAIKLVHDEKEHSDWSLRILHYGPLKWSDHESKVPGRPLVSSTVFLLLTNARIWTTLLFAYIATILPPFYYVYQIHRVPINYLLVNLAVADILYAVFIAPDVYFRLTATHPEGMTGTVLCKLLTGGIIAWIGATSAIVTLAAIAIERYYAVVYPFGDKGNFTKRKLKVRH